MAGAEIESLLDSEGDPSRARLAATYLELCCEIGQHAILRPGYTACDSYYSSRRLRDCL